MEVIWSGPSSSQLCHRAGSWFYTRSFRSRWSPCPPRWWRSERRVWCGPCPCPPASRRCGYERGGGPRPTQNHTSRWNGFSQKGVCQSRCFDRGHQARPGLGGEIVSPHWPGKVPCWNCFRWGVCGGSRICSNVLICLQNLFYSQHLPHSPLWLLFK